MATTLRSDFAETLHNGVKLVQAGPPEGLTTQDNFKTYTFGVTDLRCKAAIRTCTQTIKTTDNMIGLLFN